MATLPLVLALAALAFAGPQPPAPKETTGAGSRKFRLTHYWVTKLKLADPSVGVRIVDQDGNHLAYITAESKKNLDIEGTGEIVEGDLKGTRINWMSNKLSVQGNVYHVLPKGVWARAGRRDDLVPFKSVAVDLGNLPWKDYCTRDGPLIPRGTRLHIKELDGMKMPDGTIHDGWVKAQDTGGAIYGLHLDLFCGYQEDCPKLPRYVTVSFNGLDDIPSDYAYGLVKRSADRKKPYFCKR